MKKILLILFMAVGCFSVALGRQGANCQKLDPIQVLDSLRQEDAVSDIQGSDIIDYDKIKLPPLSVFMKAAESYANVKFYEAKTREQELLLKVSRKEWLKYFRLQGNYQYGTYMTYQVEPGSINPGDLTSSLRNQHMYNVGLGITVPLDDVFARKNKNDVARAKVEQSKYEHAAMLEDRQMLILKAYNDVVKNLELLKVNAQTVALYNAQMRISERDFINGRIDIITLSLERARRTSATVAYQESKAALHNAVSILELLTKIKIIK